MVAGLPGGAADAVSWLGQVAGHLVAVLALADTPQRAALLAVAMLTAVVLAVEVAGSLSASASASVARVTGTVPVRRKVAALRGKSWRVAFLPQRDPDARGHSRPRAPSGGPSGRLTPAPGSGRDRARPGLRGRLPPARRSRPALQLPVPTRWKAPLAMSVLFGVPVDAAYHLVYDLTSVLTPLFGGAAAVAAIIGCTLAVRILVAPLTSGVPRAQAAAARLAPEIQRLRGRYGRQPDRFQRQLTLLYQAGRDQPVRRVRPAARAVAGVQRAVPAVPLPAVSRLVRTCCCPATCSACRSAVTGCRARRCSVRTAPCSPGSSPCWRWPAGCWPGW